MSPTIDSVQAILDSKIPVGIVVAGGEEESGLLETSPDPLIRQLWDSKMTIDHSTTPDVNKDHLIVQVSFGLFAAVRRL